MTKSKFIKGIGKKRAYDQIKMWAEDRERKLREVMNRYMQRYQQLEQEDKIMRREDTISEESRRPNEQRRNHERREKRTQGKDYCYRFAAGTCTWEKNVDMCMR